jgi:hypothetical protein
MAKILIWLASAMARRSRWIESSVMFLSGSTPEALAASALLLDEIRRHRRMQRVRKLAVHARSLKNTYSSGQAPSGGACSTCKRARSTLPEAFGDGSVFRRPTNGEDRVAAGAHPWP